MAQHKDFSKEYGRGVTEPQDRVMQGQSGLSGQAPQDYVRDERQRPQQQAEQRSWPQQQGGGPRSQQGQYGVERGNVYANSPSNPYANNPQGSPGMGEPWTESRYGTQPGYDASDFEHGGYGIAGEAQSYGQEGGRHRGQAQYGGGEQQGPRGLSGYPRGAYSGYEDYPPSAFPGGSYEGGERYQSGGYQGGGGLHQGRYESSRGQGHTTWNESHPGGYGAQEGYGQGYAQQQRSRGEWAEPYRGQDRHDQFDPHYRQWRQEQIRKLDDDYRAWREENYGKFSNEFSEWRSKRLGQQQTQGGGQAGSAEDKRGTGKLASEGSNQATAGQHRDKDKP